jgi:hypothetical protein
MENYWSISTGSLENGVTETCHAREHESKPIRDGREMEGPKPDPAQLTSIAIQKYEYKKLHNVPN